MARKGGGSAIALVVFVFLFIVALALSITFFAQKLSAQSKLADYEALDREMVGPGEQNSEAFGAVRDAARKERETVYGYLIEQHQDMANLVAGDSALSLDSIREQFEGVGLPDGGNALSEIRRINTLLTNETQRADQLQSALDEANQQAAAQTQRVAMLESMTDEKIAALRAQLADQTSAFDSFQSSSASQHDDFIGMYEQAKADAKADLREKEAEVRSLRNEITKLNSRIQGMALIINENRLNAPDMKLETDGEIIEVVAKDGLVYIDLGKADNLILGMTFEVFDAASGVRIEQESNGQVVHSGGKGAIEVVRFSEDGGSAACRIVREEFGRPITTGDLVSNIVYDRNRLFRFYVYGDFDMNGDGRSTPGERSRVVNLIEQWGGEVVDGPDMPVDTDFLVLGESPVFPQSPPDDPPPTPEQIETYLRQQEVYRTYHQLAGLAGELQVPLLNQSRFLTLIGYYRN